MDFLTNNILAYETFKNSLQAIANTVKDVETANVGYFFRDEENDNYLSNYVNEVNELRKSIASFNNLFEDYMMELEQAEFENWEAEQIKNETDYYSEGALINEGFNE